VSLNVCDIPGKVFLIEILTASSLLGISPVPKRTASMALEELIVPVLSVAITIFSSEIF
jgi:hypothetical protein